MLIIRRRVGERIVIGSNIEVTVASSSKRVVRLAIAAPKGIPILRGEVHDTVVAANRAATSAIIELEPVPAGEEDGESTAAAIASASVAETEAATDDERAEETEAPGRPVSGSVPAQQPLA